MPTKIRLQRHGRKGRPIFHIVAADARAKRDGKFIEKLGIYNPNVNPASIDLNFDRCLHWVKVGAQPTDTVRAILSYKGVMMKNHLDKGVLKGAFSQEEADSRFEKWASDKSKRIDGKVEGLAKAEADDAAKKHAAEVEVKETRAKELRARNSDVTEEEAEEVVAEATEEAAAPAEEAAAPVEEAAAPVEEAAAPAEEAAAPAEEAAAPAEEAAAPAEEAAAPAEEAAAPAEENKAEGEAPAAEGSEEEKK